MYNVRKWSGQDPDGHLKRYRWYVYGPMMVQTKPDAVVVQEGTIKVRCGSRWTPEKVQLMYLWSGSGTISNDCSNGPVRSQNGQL
jgi:hypothetical protein